MSVSKAFRISCYSSMTIMGHVGSLITVQLWGWFACRLLAGCTHRSKEWVLWLYKQRYEKERTPAGWGGGGQMATSWGGRGTDQEGPEKRGLGGNGDAKSKGGNSLGTSWSLSSLLPFLAYYCQSSQGVLPLHFLLLPKKAWVLCVPLPFGLSLAVSSRRIFHITEVSDISVRCELLPWVI